MWKKTDNEPEGRAVEEKPKPLQPSRTTAKGAAVIGNSIIIDGDVTGSEDLIIHGRVKGQVSLPDHSLQIGSDGRLEARAKARSIHVDGRVEGDLTADHEIVIRATGDVQGNLVAPRIGLEEGAKFKGSIDMEPKSASSQPKAGQQAGEPLSGTSRQHQGGQSQDDKRKPDATSASENKATG